ncbi:Hsp20/alpha crystallin family protein [Enterococcus saccharolyticus]|uniref:Heat-shock protein n=1 Tax=Candidatus Enterococcus willemsii TaxID=1857215 RepID=A0ABQ6Z229_9ENTE|nr:MULTISPECIES: Hsp20/alpha crystallin family protein [Enterococcus]KAF1305624.1 heat-shock protein [Enterococcus sp. CU12B]MCD5000886.1 Hsp20/alpha crystallin family protein [Enterococcus saccharolyticus]
MANDVTPRNSSLFDMTPFDFLGNAGRNFLDGFKENLVKTDIFETEENYTVEAELPGIPKENIQVDYTNGVLTIEGAHQTETEKKDDKGTVVRSERSYNSVKRQFMIDNVKEEDIKAAYQDGILKITLPKAQVKVEHKKAIPIE